MINKGDCGEFVEFQIQRNAAQLSRNLLNYLEDMGVQNERIRKRILDLINDNKRDLLSEISRYEIYLKTKE